MTLARLREVSKDEIMPMLSEFAAQASALEQVEQIILFGSLSRGQLTEASDIDLAILLEDGADVREMKERLRLLKRLHLSWPCDMMIFTVSWFRGRANFGGICMEIARSGETLYERSRLVEHS